LILSESLGLVAGALVTCSLIPQLIRVFKLKSAREISMLFTTLLLLGLFLWLAYGILLGLAPGYHLECNRGPFCRYTSICEAKVWQIAE